jgi:hypothetical protein
MIHGDRIARLRHRVGAKNVGWLDAGPQLGQHFGRGRKIVASDRESRAVDGSGRSASDDGKRIAFAPHALHLTNAFQHAGLVGATRASAGHYQAKRIFHS